MGRNDRRGAVSVLLCVILLAMVVLTGAAGDACSLAVANSYAQRIHYLSAQSVLAEYNRPLLEDYGLLAFSGGSEEIAEKIRDYADRMKRVQPDAGKELVFFDVALKDVQVQCQDSLLSDPAVFREQIRTVMEYQALETGVDALRSLLTGSADISGLYQSARQSYDAEKTAAAEVPAPDPETGETAESPAARDPLDIRQMEFDSEAVPEGHTLRNRMVIDSLPSRNTGSTSHREKHYSLGEEDALMDLGKESADALEKFYSYLDSGGDKLLMLGYIHTHFRSQLRADAAPGETFFLGEKEYILKGKLSDRDNLSAVRRDLFLLRTALNIAHIYADPDKNRLTLEAAAATGAELFLPAVQFLIVTAWAGAEAKEDVDTLMNGGRIPFFKTASDWKLSLDSIYGEASVQPGHESGRGLDYDGYLDLLLLTKGLEDMTLRSMDLIQIDLKGRSDRSFDLRNCVTSFSDTAQFERIAYLPTVLPGVIEDNAMQAEGVFGY